MTDYGNAIIGYRIYIRTSVYTQFEQDLINCPDTDSVTSVCTLPVSVLQAEPFNLDFGESIYAKVIAYNSIGESPESASGNGAIVSIVVSPDAPIELKRDNLATTTSQIGLMWSDGASDGGAEVIDYRVSYD